MSGRTMLEQEFYEQFRDQGMDEYSAKEMAREWAIDSGEYDESSATCPKCGVAVTGETPSGFYLDHDERCGGDLSEPQADEPRDGGS